MYVNVVFYLNLKFSLLFIHHLKLLRHTLSLYIWVSQMKLRIHMISLKLRKYSNYSKYFRYHGTFIFCLLYLLFRASLTLRPLSIIQRKCLFYDESNANLQVYNVNVCKLTCRANAALQLCGCKPYYYPFISKFNSGRMCCVE